MAVDLDYVTVTVKYGAPAEIIAGDSLDFYVAVPGDLVGWTGSARLTGLGTMDATSVTVVNNDFRVKFEGQSAGGTKDLAPGQYVLTVWATSGNDRYTVEQYRLTIRADLSTGSPDLEHAVKMVDLLTAAIQARVSGTPDGGVESYEINGRKVNKMTTPQLRALLNLYRAEVRALMNPGAPIARVKATFGSAGFEPMQKRRYS